MSEQTSRLHELAGRCGVATEYWDWQGRHVVVATDTIVAVLAALGRAAGTDAEIEASLAAVDDEPWRRLLPPVVVTVSGRSDHVLVHVTDGDWVRLHVRDELGQRHELTQLDRWVPPRELDGVLVGEATFALPAELPLGWHTIIATLASGEHSCPLVVTPARMELPTEAWGTQRWGLMTQLYRCGRAVVGRRGPCRPGRAGRVEGAGWGRLHPGQPAARRGTLRPMEPSPYLPTTRRFANPLYLRVEDIPEVAYLTRRRPRPLWSRTPCRRGPQPGRRIDRDAAWAPNGAPWRPCSPRVRRAASADLAATALRG